MKFLRIVSLLESILDVVTKLEYHLLFKPKDDSNSTDHVATFAASSALDLKNQLKNISDNPIPPVELGEYYVIKIFKRNF